MPVRGSCLAHYFLTIWLTIVITRRITSNGSSRLRVGLPTDEINSNTYIAVADQLHNLLLAFGVLLDRVNPALLHCSSLPITTRRRATTP